MHLDSEILFGQIAIKTGFCTKEDVEECIKEQERHQGTKEGGSLGKIMFRKRLLNFEQVNDVLHVQNFSGVQKHNRMFGELALKNGFVSEKEVRDCLICQDRLIQGGLSVPRLGEMLVQLGLMTEQVK